MTDVQTNFKTTVVCPCGCGAEGAPRQRKNRDGTHHARSCTCRSCGAGRYAKDEKRRVGRYASRSGLTQQSGSGRKIGYDLGGVCAVEETSERTITKHLRLWWATVEVQRKLARVRRQKYQPWAFIASWDDRPQLVVMDPDGFAALCLAANGSDMETAVTLVDQLLEATFPPCETEGDE